MFERLKSKLSPLRESGPEERPVGGPDAAHGRSSDEPGWRRITQSARDLAPMTQQRQRELAAWLWASNPLANRLIELPVAYLLAEGVRLSVPDPDAQSWLDAFWRDPINNMDLKLPRKVRELALYGEQCWPVFVNRFNGHMRLGYLDPARILEVIPDPDNHEQPIGVLAAPLNAQPASGGPLKYRIIINGPENVFSARTQRLRAEFGDAECFYFAVNTLSGASRGHSDLLAGMDWLDGYDQALYGELQRWDFLRSFIWDVTLKGATPEEVERRAASINVPSAGGLRVHNDAEEWQAVTPDLQSVNGSDFARLFRNHILGGQTMPEHWFGGGGDVNRATAGSMAEPTAKVFSMRQRIWRYILESVGQHQVNAILRLAGRQAETAEKNFRVMAVFPEMLAKDVATYSQSLSQITEAAVKALENKVIRPDTARLLMNACTAPLGIELPKENYEEAEEGEPRTGQSGAGRPGASGLD